MIKDDFVSFKYSHPTMDDFVQTVIIHPNWDDFIWVIFIHFWIGSIPHFKFALTRAAVKIACICMCPCMLRAHACR